MEETKTTCSICGTDIFRSGSRGRLKKFCSACYQTKEAARKKAAAELKAKELREIRSRTTTFCKTCGKALPQYPGKGKLRIFCSGSCTIKDEKNKEKRKARLANWIKANPGKWRQIRKRHDERRDPEKLRERARRRHENYSSNLADPYIKHLLTQGTAISKKAVPQSLIDLKRVQVSITRKLKELQDAEPHDRD